MDLLVSFKPVYAATGCQSATNKWLSVPKHGMEALLVGVRGRHA